MQSLERFRQIVLADLANMRKKFGEHLGASSRWDAILKGEHSVKDYEALAKCCTDFGTLIWILRDNAWDVQQINTALLTCFDVPESMIGQMPLHYDT